MRGASYILVLCCPVVVAGCSSHSGGMRVWGDVTFAGRPVAEGEIAFIPLDGTAGSSTGGTIKDGHYDIPASLGPKAGGSYNVRIRALAKSGRTARNPRNPKGPPVTLTEDYIPAQYNSSSKLTVVISARPGDNKFDFRLDPASD